LVFAVLLSIDCQEQLLSPRLVLGILELKHRCESIYWVQRSLKILRRPCEKTLKPRLSSKKQKEANRIGVVSATSVSNTPACNRTILLRHPEVGIAARLSAR
jgi:hypothetical protein